MTSFFKKFFGLQQKNNEQANHIVKTKGAQARRLQFEPLEERQLLAVTAAEYDAIREKYADLGFASNMSSYNIVEITADKLSATSLQNGINAAKASTRNDIIVIRTTDTANKITLTGSELVININAAQNGSIAIVSLGTVPLTIDGNGKSRLFYIDGSSNVSMGGIAFTGGYKLGHNGGAIYSVTSTLRLTDTTFLNNTSLGDDWWISGGAIRSEYGGNLQVYNSLFENNTSKFSGGGISTSDVSVTIRNTDFIGNKSLSFGGGIYVNGGGSLSVENVKLINNTSQAENDGHGGGAWIENCTANLSNITVRGNRSSWGGGIMSKIATVIASYITLNDNFAQYDGGGANFNSSNATLSNMSLWENYSGLYGGALFFESAKGIITNVTIGNNVSGIDGGGIYTRHETDLTLTNVTVTANTALWGGGLYIHEPTNITLYNTIVAGNIAKNLRSDVYYNNESKPFKGSNNLIGMGENFIGMTNGVNANQVGTVNAPLDAMLGPMTDFGNGIPVMPLLSVSPAIDAGISRSGAPSIDAAGKQRYDAPNVTNKGSGSPNYIDIGAYEYQGTAASSGTVVSLKNLAFTPKGIAVDSKDRVYVADYLNNRVICYTPSGTQLFTFGTWGEGDGQLYHPTDIAIDKSDNVYIVSGNNTVQVF
ncbi:MAG: choice-of-anchor Q domain-containing protein, partial [Thermoguttaceae bacterium]